MACTHCGIYWELSSHLIYIVLIVECPWEWSGYFVQAKYILWLKALWKESQRDLWRLWLLIWKKRWGSRFDDDFLPLCVHKLTERHCSRRLCVTLPVISSLYFLLVFFVVDCTTYYYCFSLPPLSLSCYRLVEWNMLISATQKLHPMPAALLQLLILSMLKSEKVVLKLNNLTHKLSRID